MNETHINCLFYNDANEEIKLLDECEQRMYLYKLYKESLRVNH